MKLSYLTQACSPLWERQLDSHQHPGIDPDICSIHYRAQEVTPGGLFVAIKGARHDGHDYIDAARERGAAAVIVDQWIKTDLRTIAVKNSRRALSSISSLFYGNPSSELVLIGVSGTNGKTTTTWLVEHILKAAGFNTGVIGTINWRFNDQVHDTPVTTPESADLHRMLRTMADAGVTHAIMEVSSHALDLHRVRDCAFDRAVFTNLTQDHLDYHKTMGAYWACKKKLYTRLLEKSGKNSRAVINIDDPRGAELAPTLTPEPVTTGVSRDAQVRAEEIDDHISGLSARLTLNDDGCRISSPLTGGFNLENILSAAGTAHSLDIPADIICRGISDCLGVPGRLERIEPGAGRHVFVDYAHTPDALDSILRTLKHRAPARIITVFGCGGDRDRSKRPLMGEIALRYSDIALVTSDNPRSEPPRAIIDDILKGMVLPDQDPADVVELAACLSSPSQEPGKILVETDRQKALVGAVALSHPQDIIIAAGKGHETYQVTARGTIDFDDRTLLRSALSAMADLRGKE